MGKGRERGKARERERERERMESVSLQRKIEKKIDCKKYYFKQNHTLFDLIFFVSSEASLRSGFIRDSVYSLG